MAQDTAIHDGYRTVGKPVPRMDGPGKVTGQTLYTDDLKLPRMLHAKVLGSAYSHARIRSIDTAAARSQPGVEAVITAAELPPHKKDPSNRRQVIFADDEVLFAEQPLAAVLAVDPHVAEEALALIQVEYEELPVALDPLEAMKEDSPLVRAPLGDVDRSEEQGHVTLDVEQEEAKGKATNISGQISFTRGDMDAGFAEADRVVEGSWRSAMVHQSYIEPHSTIADYNAGGELSVWTSTQGPFQIRDGLCQALDLPQTRVRVIPMEVGGGFGGKINLTELMVAALAMVVRRPVKYIMSRKQDLMAATPSPQVVVQLKAGMIADGTLTALQARLIYDCGAFPGAAMLPGCLLIGGYYRCANLDIQGYEVMTNKVSVGALRAPGTYNATFAIESAIEMLAGELGLDSLEVRLKNVVEKGDPLPSGQPYPVIGARQCLEAIGDSAIWKERVQSRKRPNTGVGVALGGWLGGLQPSAASVRLNADGTISVIVGSADITGTNTTFAQIAAEVLNLPLSMVGATTGDTDTAPYAGISAGSKTAFIVGRAVKMAAEQAREQIMAIAANPLEAAPEELEMADGVVRVAGNQEKSVTFARIGAMSTAFAARYAPVIGTGTLAASKPGPGFTVQAAEVEIDPDTGNVTVLRYAIAQDVGFALNPMSVAGQMQGGASQGLGVALSEEMQFDESGHLLNANLLDYRVPTTQDLPPIEAIIVEVPSEDGPYGARIVGEPSIVAGAAAVANAVADAIGARVMEVPITPERVLGVLRKD